MRPPSVEEATCSTCETAGAEAAVMPESTGDDKINSEYNLRADVGQWEIQ